MFKLNQLLWYSDPGHAWLRVHFDDILRAESHGVTFTAWSYQSKRYAYLEEDCDAFKYLKFLISMGVNPEFLKTIPEKHSEKPSPIRSKPSYKLKG